MMTDEPRVRRLEEGRGVGVIGQELDAASKVSVGVAAPNDERSHVLFHVSNSFRWHVELVPMSKVADALLVSQAHLTAHTGHEEEREGSER